VGLKAAAEFATAPDMWIEQADGMLDYRYCDWYVDVLKAAMEAPPPPLIWPVLRLMGWRSSRQNLIPGDDQFFDALAKGVALAADDFAKQLREGPANEHRHLSQYRFSHSGMGIHHG
jgi:hypothetical protein